MNHIIKVNHLVTPRKGQTRTIRIINISDIHFGKKMKVEKVRRAFQLAEGFKPSYICLLGDNLDTTNVVDESIKKDEFFDILKYSGSIAPTMISLADHDQRYSDGEGHIKIDYREDLWNQVDKIDNVHVLNNSDYEDDHVRFLGYTLPSYYYHGKYDLPEYSRCNQTRVDEDVSVLLEDMEWYEDMFTSYMHNPCNKFSAVLFHSPQNVTNNDVAYYLSGFDHIYSGHMHQGCMPPLLDDLIPGIKGIISPQKTLFPDNSRGVIHTTYGSLCVINGGITKIHESANMVLQPFNALFPMHMDVIDIVPAKEKEYQKAYTKKSYYKYVK